MAAFYSRVILILSVANLACCSLTDSQFLGNGQKGTLHLNLGITFAPADGTLYSGSARVCVTSGAVRGRVSADSEYVDDFLPFNTAKECVDLRLEENHAKRGAISISLNREGAHRLRWNDRLAIRADVYMKGEHVGHYDDFAINAYQSAGTDDDWTYFVTCGQESSESLDLCHTHHPEDFEYTIDGRALISIDQKYSQLLTNDVEVQRVTHLELGKILAQTAEERITGKDRTEERAHAFCKTLKYERFVGEMPSLADGGPAPQKLRNVSDNRLDRWESVSRVYDSSKKVWEPYLYFSGEVTCVRRLGGSWEDKGPQTFEEVLKKMKLRRA